MLKPSLKTFVNRDFCKDVPWCIATVLVHPLVAQFIPALHTHHGTFFIKPLCSGPSSGTDALVNRLRSVSAWTPSPESQVFLYFIGNYSTHTRVLRFCFGPVWEPLAFSWWLQPTRTCLLCVECGLVWCWLYEIQITWGSRSNAGHGCPTCKG